MWRLSDATVRFGATTALDRVDLVVETDELLVVLGPSGCGKSTMLRVVAGLQALTGGTVEIDGHDVAGRAPHERGVGMMFQDATLFPHRDVSGNIEFGLRMAGMAAPDRTARVAELLELVGLDGFAHTDVDTLSGGEAQRVALARALAPRPRIVLLDEPFGALDRALRDRLVDDLPRLLRTAGTAAIHVTHDHEEAFAMADRIAVMDHGRILRTATPQDLVADPRTETVARFLGHTNIVGDHDDRRVLRRDAATVDPDGELDATVTATRFRGDGFDVDLDSMLGPLRFRLSERLEIGERIRLRIDPRRVAPVAVD